jgi:hypothetical protein
VEGPCEHGNEPSGYIKCWEPGVAEQLAVSQEGLSSMELVSLVSWQFQIRNISKDKHDLRIMHSFNTIPVRNAL